MSIEVQNQSNQSLTILQVLPALNLGGVERGTIELAIYLKQQGHQPIIVSAGGAMVETLLAYDITHIELNVGEKSLSSLLLIKRLQNLMLELQVDIVHARSRLPAWLCFWAIKRFKQISKPQFVTTLHGLHSVNRYSSIMARGDAVIAVSKTAKKYLLNHFNKYLKAEPKLIYRGIDPQFKYQHQVNSAWLATFREKLPVDFNLAKKANTVLLPGRLSQIKGIEHLVHWLKNTNKACKLLLTANIDDSKYSQKVQQLFNQYQLADHVIWLGVENNMPNLYAAVDLVVSVNNKAESFGRTVLEALSVGTPVVAFAHGGVAEIMSELYPEGQVNEGDDIELAKRIDAFLTQAPQVSPHNKFSNQDMFDSTMAVYQKLVDDKGLGQS